eukprot:CAMPEP_0116829548 /NCGR_PEP_ID=MMETSP0418-20121206/4276_1 /TAXON_ID=1158023 /ORGANISM="Astrosyne radiata, Strain 13vi08-1A" /LENGTH=278 /DNA_ID=CAMNT_0004458567 /DNA_START=443 /DNA_END=1279 /DNA_ORIENTATION=+
MAGGKHVHPLPCGSHSQIHRTHKSRRLPREESQETSAPFMQIHTTFLLILSLFFGFCASAQPCQKVTTVKNIDLEMFVSKKWYIHQQAVSRYSPIPWNNCAWAEYNIWDNPNFWGYNMGIIRSAADNDGNQNAILLCGATPNHHHCRHRHCKEEANSKLTMGPCDFPPFWFFGAEPHWIVAYNETEGYALVSGGQPTIATIRGKVAGCRTNHHLGLWIYLRSKERNETTIQKVRQIAKNQGFDLSVLHNVTWVNCTTSFDNDDDDSGDLAITSRLQGS